MSPSLNKAIGKYITAHYPTDVLIKGYVFMTDSLLRKLEDFIDEISIAFEISEDEALKMVFTHLKDSPDKIVLVNQIANDVEHLSIFSVEELEEITAKIIEDKFALARVQSYENAAKYRDIELQLKKAIERKKAINA